MPEPSQAHVSSTVGDALNLYIGTPTSPYGNEVSTKVNFNGINFVRFDEKANMLQI